MSQKHTPLPWKMLDVRDNRGNLCAYAVWPDIERPYANSPRGSQICRTPDGTEPQKQANAEFIVKACNNHHQMLQALKQIAHELPECWYDSVVDGELTITIDASVMESILDVIGHAQAE